MITACKIENRNYQNDNAVRNVISLHQSFPTLINKVLLPTRLVL
jgi:hypothetical protein